MAAAALAIYVLFVILTMGVRVAIQVRRVGSTGFNRVHGRPGSAEWTAGFLFMFGLAACALAPALDLLNVMEPIAAIDSDIVNYIGLVLASVGTLLVFAAQMAMGDSWRIGVEHEERTELVTDGPFSVVRNPIFAAVIPAAIGFALMVPSAVAFIALAIVAVAIELQVRVVEEPYLVRTHGDAYRAYASCVGRFAPGLGLLASSEG